MTNTKRTADPVADIFAGLDARAAPAAPAAVAPQPSKTLEQAQADALEAALVDPQGHALVAKIHKRKGEDLARAALAGITSGRPRRELHRPAAGKQRQLTVGSVGGRLDITELVAGRSGRYAQDLEAWALAAQRDASQRGVLVVWDGLHYSISLDAQVQPGTITETRRSDLADWRARQL